jgi:hypothetical protein
MNARIRQYSTIISVVIVLGLTFHVFTDVRYEKSELEFTTAVSNNHFRGVIVTLIRSTNRSISLAMNMIHSVVKFHPSNTGHPYPFVIFHDQNFTSNMREHILSCMLKSNKNIQISFASIDLHTTVIPDVGSRGDKPIGYRLMCRFWAYDVFHHPAIVQGHYDYLMRMDDDSYFFDTIPEDLFSYTNHQNLDYVYRSLYSEDSRAMHPIERLYLNTTSKRIGCIYNNFFIIRLKWFYQSVRVQSFLRELLKDDLILRQYIGDGCIHAAILEIDNQVKVHHMTNIPYGHNIHLMPVDSAYFRLQIINGFSEEILNSCQQLTVIDANYYRLKKIKMSE